MIEITDKSLCCGCNACAQSCPKQCIEMLADEEGFLYPFVDLSQCINCGLCTKVCPTINQDSPKEPLAVYAAKNKNESIRLNSSSGGIFTPLAEHIISECGVVFGAMFDDEWNVKHSYTETIEGLAKFRGSKYVQSTIGDSYSVAKKFLTENRKVLFSGTPCQIAGLKKFLHKEYDNLFTVEVVCHGVPSPKVWHDYLKYKQEGVAVKHEQDKQIGLTKITNISFRDKSDGWKKFSFRMEYTNQDQIPNNVEPAKDINSTIEITPYKMDTYMAGFLKNLTLRPSCFHCAARKGKSGADISIADYWNIEAVHSGFDDDKGCGLVLVNSERGEHLYNSISNQIDSINSFYKKAIIFNKCIIESVERPSQRTLFWNIYHQKGIESIKFVCKQMKRPIYKRVISRLKRIILTKLSSL